MSFPIQLPRRVKEQIILLNGQLSRIAFVPFGCPSCLLLETALLAVPEHSERGREGGEAEESHIKHVWAFSCVNARCGDMTDWGALPVSWHLIQKIKLQ